MPFDTAPRCPEPQPDHQGRRTLERKWKHALAYVSQLWRPSNTLEQTHCTVARYAMHLIDLTTGAAYTVQQLLNTAPAVITRTAEQGDPNGTSSVTVSGTFAEINGVYLHAGLFGGVKTFSKLGGTWNGTAAVPEDKYLHKTSGKWTFSSVVGDGVEGEIQTVILQSGVTNFQSPTDVSSWIAFDGNVPQTEISVTGDTGPLTPTAIGQLCIVDTSDAYVAAQVDPPIWLGPLNS